MINKNYNYLYLILLDVRYINVSSMLDALEHEKIDLVVMDTFSMASLQPMLDEKSLKVGAMIKSPAGFGVVLGGLSLALVDDMQSEIMVRSSVFSDFIAALKPKLPV